MFAILLCFCFFWKWFKITSEGAKVFKDTCWKEMLLFQWCRSEFEFELKDPGHLFRFVVLFLWHILTWSCSRTPNAPVLSRSWYPQVWITSWSRLVRSWRQHHPKHIGVSLDGAAWGCFCGMLTCNSRVKAAWKESILGLMTRPRRSRTTGNTLLTRAEFAN